MIKQFYVTGDTHGDMSRFSWLEMTNPEEIGVIILGDSGCNFYKSTSRRNAIKQSLEYFGCYFYLVRGNHEDRPENLLGAEKIYDENIQGDVLYESAFPHVRYLMDGNRYYFNNHRTLVIGGAYSVDKWYRLKNHYTWYPEEQLTREEMDSISQKIYGERFDFVLTHTCPEKWQPTDLFLAGLDQSTVDKSMEAWLDSVKTQIDWDIWLFGHFHADRIERPRVEMFFKAIEDIEEIWDRWHNPEYLGETYFRTSPNYYEEI